MKLLAGFVLALIFTVILELPIIRISGVCKKNTYIILVNILTNVTFNLILFILRFYKSGLDTGFTIISEGVLIPVVESFLYIAVSDEKKRKIFLFTYIANAFSYFAGGYLLSAILK